MNIELKAVKIHKGLSQETTCYTANLYVDGKKAAECSNRGCGGPDEVHWLNDDSRKAVLAHVAATPIKIHYVKDDTHVEMENTLDMFLGHLLSVWEYNDWLKRKLRHNLLFRLENDMEDEWRTVRCPKNQRDAAEKYVRDKYGDRVVELRR